MERHAIRMGPDNLLVHIWNQSSQIDRYGLDLIQIGPFTLCSCGDREFSTVIIVQSGQASRAPKIPFYALTAFERKALSIGYPLDDPLTILPYVGA